MGPDDIFEVLTVPENRFQGFLLLGLEVSEIPFMKGFGAAVDNGNRALQVMGKRQP